ncbi:MAG: hypothetical protein DME24_14030 [Verrucomicrobia bacterium]|nr:MAG: hypothetical protein DME24_14030 [Verrucomicrobiota bacterium]
MLNVSFCGGTGSGSAGDAVPSKGTSPAGMLKRATSVPFIQAMNPSSLNASSRSSLMSAGFVTTKVLRRKTQV